MKKKIAAVLVATACATPAVAAVGAEEAQALGASLTPWGAEPGGNKDGSIPAYDAKNLPLKLPAGWDYTKKGYPDPWNEKPLYSITAQNVEQYAGKLDGYADVFKKYPNYRIDVYPTHRTVYYPKHLVDNMAKNAVECKGIQDDLKLSGCYGGLPFPIPKNGRQVMWNHLLAYMGIHHHSDALQSWVIPPDGHAVLQARLYTTNKFTTVAPSMAGKVIKTGEVYRKNRSDYTAPARQVGTKLLLFYSMDSLDVGSRVWQYIPGQRRVKLAPDLSYDTPSPVGGGVTTMDDNLGFDGAVDRYDFKLVGKKEKLIPYNSFPLTNPTTCPDTKVVSNQHFPHPDCIRWELHRVWQVQATLRPGYRHVYKTRTFYWDEDNPGTGVAENYDAAGKLYRMVAVNPYPFLDANGGMNVNCIFAMDLFTGAWGFNGSLGIEGGMWYPTTPRDDIYFSPESLAGEGIR